MRYENSKEYKAKLQGLSVAYNKVFDRGSPFTQDVLKDLAKFCRAHESAFHQDPRIHAALEGRREVWLKIQQMLDLSPDELYNLHKIKEYQPEEKPIVASTIANPTAAL